MAIWNPANRLEMVFCAAKPATMPTTPADASMLVPNVPHFLEQHQDRRRGEENNDGVDHLADDVNLRINLARLQDCRRR